MSDEVDKSLDSHGFTLIRKLGSGAFSTVCLAKDASANRLVAIKIMENASSPPRDVRAAFEREVKCMKNIASSFVVAFIDSFESEHYFYIVMEYVDGVSLLSLITKSGSLGECDARWIFAQLVLAMKDVHQTSRVVHRDIKPDNILVTPRGAIKVIDFGLSKPFFDGDELFRTACGSVDYASPELLLRKPYTTKTDVWSMGVCLFAMLSGKLPFGCANLRKTMKRILEASPPLDELAVSANCIDLLRKMLTRDAQQRISIDEIMKHPWLAAAIDSSSAHRSLGKAHHTKSCDLQKCRIFRRAITMRKTVCPSSDPSKPSVETFAG